MGLSNPKPIFGVHSVTPYSRTDGTFYGTVKVLKGSSANLSNALVKLQGGSQQFPWSVEVGAAQAEVSLKIGEYPDFLWTLFTGQAPTAVATDATGTLSTLTNKQGTSVMDATTGIASVGLTTGKAGDLKFGKYVVKAVSATTVDVYLSTDADMARGTAGSYLDDSLKIASAQTITTAGVKTSIANFGIDLVGGSGAIALMTGDTATFEVKPPSNSSSSVVVGGAASVLPEFGMIIMAQKTGTLQLTELDFFRCKASGLPLGFQEKAFAEADVKVEAFYDSTKDGVYEMRRIEETS